MIRGATATKYEPICGGCGKPIEADVTGARRYTMMMRLDGGPADSVHSHADCKREYEINQREARIAAEEAKIANLRAQT